MSFVRVQHIYNAKSGLAEDGVVNVFHFLGPALATPALEDLAEAVIGFYDSGTATIHSLIHSSSLAAARHTVKVYDMNAAPPAPPVYEVTTTPTSPANGTANNGMPHEVALCLSYRSTPAAGQIPARHRGRIYLGPLNTGALEEDTTTHRISCTVGTRDLILDRGEAFKAAALVAGWSWVGFSPTSAGPSRPIVGEAGVFIINQLLVDDAPDTQRRRGEARTVVDVRTL